MTESAQQIALLTAMGWHHIRPRARRGKPDGIAPGDGKGGWTRLPDLTLDLMASAEAIMTEDEGDRYYVELWAICRPTGSEPGRLAHRRAFVCATKEQRREAFLRVRGLWVDGA